MTDQEQLDVPTPIVSLAAKLAKVTARVQAVPRDAQHDHFKFRYSSPDAVFEAVRGPLAAENVALLPVSAGPVELLREIKGDKSVRHHVRVPIRLVFVDGDSGERFEAEWIGEGIDAEASACSKAMTNAARTFLRIAFLIPQEHEDQPPRGGQQRAVRDQDKITGALIEQLSNAFHAAGTPGEEFSKWLHDHGVNVEAGIDPGVRTMTVKQAQEALTFLRGLGTPVDAESTPP